MSNFIVLSSQRTGSSLVCQWLENKTGVEYLKELPGHEYKKIEGDKIVNKILELKLNRGSKLQIQKLQQQLIDIEKKLNLEND